MATLCESVTKNNTWACGDRCDNPLSEIHLLKTYTHEGTQAAAFIARDDESKSLIVAFRGSQSAKSYFFDANFLLRHPVWIQNDAVKVHSGFDATYLGLRGEIQQDLQGFAEKWDYDIYFTGHSLGGAVSILAAADFLVKVPSRPVRVVTFGQPRVGNTEFSQYINDLGITVQRVVADGDIVPSIPTKWLGYRHTGTEFEIKDGTTYECDYECHENSGKIDFSVHAKGYYGWNSDVPATC